MASAKEVGVCVSLTSSPTMTKQHDGARDTVLRIESSTPLPARRRDSSIVIRVAVSQLGSATQLEVEVD